MSGYQSNLEQLWAAVALFRLTMGLLDIQDEEQAEKIRAEYRRQERELEQREQETPPEIRLSLRGLRRILPMSGLGWFCLYGAWAAEQVGEVRNWLSDRIGTSAPTMDLFSILYSLAENRDMTAESFALLRKGSSLSRVVEFSRAPAQPQLLTLLTLRPNISAYLLEGFPPAEGRGYHLLFPKAGGLPLHNTEFRFLSSLLKRREPQAFFLTGKPGSGKRTLAARLAAAKGAPCLHLQWSALVHANGEERSRICTEWGMDGALTCGFFLLEGPFDPSPELLAEAVRELPPAAPLFLVSDDPADFPVLSERTVIRREIGLLSAEDTRCAQRALSRKYGFLEMEPPVSYRMRIGNLKEAWAYAAGLAAEAGRAEVFQEDWNRAVQKLPGRNARAQVLEQEVRMQDLVLSADTRARLELVCRFVQNREEIDRLYRHSGREPYGKGVSALFYGPSGTGKTLAASAIARELGRELWRVDLSRVLDKYIGETEKHLADLFASAGERGCVLFFDEADALFSKRTGIETAHERYANLETSFLLQSMEEHDGVILLAANLFKNFDEAFLRRIQILVRFSMPDPALRLALWKRSFPGHPAVSEEISLERLAADLELSPAAIRAAAQTAVVLALSEGREVRPRHLRLALQNELEKEGKSALLDRLLNPENSI